jgi:hypothetical protein
MAQYRESKRIETLPAETRQCCWIGRKSTCIAQTKFNFALSANHDPLVDHLPTRTPNRSKLNERIISITAEFVTATNFSRRESASSAMHHFITQ